MTYPGGKGGVFQKIINLIPPHRVYIETHLGGGSVFRNKRPAEINIGVDIDRDLIKSWFRDPLSPKEMFNDRSFTVKEDDAVSFLKGFYFSEPKQTFVYCDPPYLHSTRKDKKIYRYEYTDSQHEELLKTIKALPCMVMISGYYSEMYMDELSGWNYKSFQVMTRHGLATEYVWMNYSEPVKLHDYSFIGKDFRERERIKKKVGRWVRKLKNLPILERQAIITAVNSVNNDGGSHV